MQNVFRSRFAVICQNQTNENMQRVNENVIVGKIETLQLQVNRLHAAVLCEGWTLESKLLNLFKERGKA